ncbi:hypothetical protein PV08_01939 [Exophiala spinifera]|uniref:Uncharacterized protein n=1 Tax=Exophiala spinifera TaxID=91928 RepID=A0A0D2CCX7_9EURO|nr:uncharacterized protein PV08_01939 [Exophiala spinifera]KIW21359.1 hypothetical protein PV08_01939 [Exophiala spinifera]
MIDGAEVDDLEDDFGDDGWQFVDLLAGDAGEMAEEALRRAAESGNEHKAYDNIINSIKLLGLSAVIGTSSSEQRSKAVSAMDNAVIETLKSGSKTARHVATRFKKFTQRLTVDPGSRSNQAAIQRITEITNYLSERDASYDDATQARERHDRQKFRERFEIEEYPDSVTAALHGTFYSDTYLPCTCQEDDKGLCLSKRYICALRLDGYTRVPGDDNHFFFDSVIAKTDDDSYEWTPIQFQLPRRTRSVVVHVGRPASSADIENDLSSSQASPGTLEDFCKIFTWGIRCFRICVTQDHKSNLICCSIERSFHNIFPQNAKPMRLSSALQQDELSARHKIFLAFAISKAFWQYYGSDWMKVEWNLETIQLLRTKNAESDAPYLNVKILEEELTQHDHNPKGASGKIPALHPWPSILNLGLLLVQLGSVTSEKTDLITIPGRLTEIKKNNYICISCCKEISADDSWPTIDIPGRDRLRYRRIVEECFPTHSAIPKALFKDGLDAEGSRLALKENIVRPLFELLQDMMDPDETPFLPPHGVQADPVTVLQGGNGLPRLVNSPSDIAADWLFGTTNSWLHSHISTQIAKYQRPKIAIIDTGFDGNARFVDRKLKLRLNLHSTAGGNHNWRDFWEAKAEPQDDDGHGTAMLSIVHRIAPFADVCVARIAGEDKDLKTNPGKTSNNLAEAILWAVKEQKADIVSLSLGWEQEQRVDKNRAISNAISEALAHCNQNLLIFAAASNRGGSKRELFPASHGSVFSIRGTNTKGKHEDFNPSLPSRGGEVFGALGLDVPTENRGRSPPYQTNRTGTSVATAVAAGLAAIILGYINIHDHKKGRWDNVRIHQGYQNLLYKLSTEPDGRKHFITLDNHSKEYEQADLDAALSSASNLKNEK